MYTYVKNDVPGKYVIFPELLSPTLYNNIGDTYEDYLKGFWVLLSPTQKQFKDENPNASIKEVFDKKLDTIVIPEYTIEDARQKKLKQIKSYDSGNKVNVFYINGDIPAWFTVEERTNYRSSIQSAKLLGIKSLKFYVKDTPIEISTDEAEIMLSQIQLYADQCYIVTKEHLNNVSKLDNIKEIDNYPYRINYPEPLKFWPNSINNETSNA